MDIVFFNNTYEERTLKYVIILAEYQSKYIFVKHRNRETWEIPGGHIETGETPDMAAERELEEETGAIQFSIRSLCDYGVLDENGKGAYGRLYHAKVMELGELLHEIDDRYFSDTIPDSLTYESIQPIIFEKMKEMIESGLNLTVLSENFAICRLDANDAMPNWATGTFLHVTRTDDELSIVCEAEMVPSDIRCEAPWRAIKVIGPLDFSLIGILAQITAVLAKACISVFVISTFETDYILVKSEHIKMAEEVLTHAGYSII